MKFMLHDAESRRLFSFYYLKRLATEDMFNGIATGSVFTNAAMMIEERTLLQTSEFCVIYRCYLMLLACPLLASLGHAIKTN